MDELVLSVGRSDHRDRALLCLAQYSSTNKQAKQAMMHLISELSVPDARRALAQIIENRPGVSTSIAMLRLAVDLQARGACSALRLGCQWCCRYF